MVLTDKYKITNSIDKLAGIDCPLIYGDYNKITSPILSVVIPTYGRPKYLRQTIESVLNQENFTLPYEIVVVDNDADAQHDTEGLIRELAIDNLLYFRNAKNIGGAGNWNRCIMLARSKWVIMCHDDDMVKSNCLATMYGIIKRHHTKSNPLGYVRSSSESFYEGNIKKEIYRASRKRLKKNDFAIIGFSNIDVLISGGTTWAGAPTCGTLINRDAFIEIGGYNESLAPCFDCHFVFQMMQKYRVSKSYYSLGLYRWAQNDTYKKSTILGLITAYNDFLNVLEKNYSFVKFFSNEHFEDCVRYYLSKAREGNVQITDDDISYIRNRYYSKFKYNLLMLIRKSYRYCKELSAD